MRKSVIVLLGLASAVVIIKGDTPNFSDVDCLISQSHFQLKAKTPYFTLYTGQAIDKKKAKDFSFMDLFSFESKKLELSGFLLTTLSRNPNSTSGLSRIFFLNNCGGGVISESTQRLFVDHPWAEHARQIVSSDFNHDGYTDLFITDHGPDRAPFDGGQAHLFLSDSKGLLHDFTKSGLPQEKLFSFNAAPLNTGGSTLLMTAVEDIPHILVNDGNGRFKNAPPNELTLPKVLQAEKLCFMTALSADLDNDGDAELFLGACDRPSPNEGLTHDRILKKIDEQHYQFTNESNLPPREANASWGTAYVLARDFNHDGRLDLLVATHNYGNTRAQINIYINEGNLHFRKTHVPFPFVQDPSSRGFILSVDVADFDGNGYPDVLFQISGERSPIYLFLNQDGETFKDASSLLPLKPNFFVTPRFIDNGPEGKKGIFVLEPEGQYSVITQN